MSDSQSGFLSKLRFHLHQVSMMGMISLPCQIRSSCAELKYPQPLLRFLTLYQLLLVLYRIKPTLCKVMHQSQSASLGSFKVDTFVGFSIVCSTVYFAPGRGEIFASASNSDRFGTLRAIMLYHWTMTLLFTCAAIPIALNELDKYVKQDYNVQTIALVV